MPRKQSADHVVMRNTDAGMYAFECLHCRDSYTPALPVSVTMLCAMTDAFIAEHRNCPEPEVPRAD